MFVSFECTNANSRTTLVRERSSADEQKAALRAAGCREYVRDCTHLQLEHVWSGVARALREYRNREALISQATDDRIEHLQETPNGRQRGIGVPCHRACGKRRLARGGAERLSSRYLVVKSLPFLGLHLLLCREVWVVGFGNRHRSRCIQQLSDDGLPEERVLSDEREFNLGQRCSEPMPVTISQRAGMAQKRDAPAIKTTGSTNPEGWFPA